MTFYYSMTNPFPQILNLQGTGLNDGDVYIGIAGQDPITNPKTVYWDAGATQPVSQPIPTTGGYLYRNGTPAAVYLTGPYSIKVLDKNGSLIYYQANVLDEVLNFIADISSEQGAGLVGFSQTESYDQGTVGLSLQREVNVKDAPYNAECDGVSDDTAAIQAAISSGARSVYIPGTPKISGPITCVSNQRIHGPAKFMLYESGDPFFFDVSGCDNVQFEGFSVDGRKSSFTYPFTTGAPDVSSRSRYSFIYGTGMNNISVENCRFTDMYSSAVYFFGSIVDEKADVNGFKLINCTYDDGQFEIADFVVCGDVLVQGCRTNENRNASGVAQLVANGMITTASNDVRVEGNYFGPCDGTGCKIESVNGATDIVGNTFELNDFSAINLQESGIERGDVANHNERVTITGNTCIRPQTFCVASNTSSANPVWNVTVTGNVFFAPVAGGVALSGENWVVADNLFIGGSVTRAGSAVSPFGVLITQENGHTVKNVAITGNTFNKNTGWGGGGGSRADVQIGETGGQNMLVEGVSIVGNLFRNFVFRGVFCQTGLDATDVLVGENIFIKDTLDGTASKDIVVSNAVHAMAWTIRNNTVAQGITCFLNGAGSVATVYGNKVTGTNSRDNANQYYVDVQGTVGRIYDISDRLIGFESSAPASGTFEVGDMVWNTAPTAGGYIGWVCTTAGTPGTWKQWGAILP